ncbi:DDE-type integrase/transposase/recombinase [Arthrobacter globiformis]|uniref:DDE-type integrase/transposase/recombinase n=1 Tax=Arthrobacter globiformis TaxID=1665 RepID=UPI0027D8A4EA|nr:DDE-type integrase/transposase/recombinase [Arthrobacter globiformis]
MSKSQPDIRIRHAVATWSEDSPRGAVSAFCRKHNVSRAWFYRVRAAAAEVGPVKALEKRPTLPSTMPTATAPGMVDLLLGARAELKKLGLDHGPLSVIAKLSRQGFRPPSRATVARIFARAGVVVPEPRKKPRSAYKRFVYPQPNACWQIDSTEWQLADGRKVAIFQLIDDHSRLALASLVATGETSAAAIAVVTLAIECHGAPQKFLSDNGSALNPTRRGRTGALVEFLKARGIEPITGKPYKPTTQGKNERFHQTLHRYLHRQPPAPSMPVLQLQVDAFDLYYNNEREHQGLPPGLTPREAWDATPKTPPPAPPEPAVAGEARNGQWTGTGARRSWEPISNWAMNTSERLSISSTTMPSSCSSERKGPKSSATAGRPKALPTSATANPQGSQPTPGEPARNGASTRRSKPASQRQRTKCPHSHETSNVYEVLRQEVSTRS